MRIHMIGMMEMLSIWRRCFRHIARDWEKADDEWKHDALNDCGYRNATDHTRAYMQRAILYNRDLPHWNPIEETL